MKYLVINIDYRNLSGCNDTLNHFAARPIIRSVDRAAFQEIVTITQHIELFLRDKEIILAVHFFCFCGSSGMCNILTKAFRVFVQEHFH